MNVNSRPSHWSMAWNVCATELLLTALPVPHHISLRNQTAPLSDEFSFPLRCTSCLSSLLLDFDSFKQQESSQFESKNLWGLSSAQEFQG